MPAVCSLHLPLPGLGSALARNDSRAFAEFDGRHLQGFPGRAQIFKSLVSTSFTTRAKPNPAQAELVTADPVLKTSLDDEKPRRTKSTGLSIVEAEIGSNRHTRR